MRHYYYSRISSIGQNASRQTENFKKHGFTTKDNIYLDKVSGAVPFFERPEAQSLFETITPSSDEVTVVIDSIDRLGRNLIDVLNTIEIFSKNKINIKSLKEGFETLIEGKENPMAVMAISVMGSLAQMERVRIKERQAEGILIARANGKFKGRKVGSVQSAERLLQRHPLIVQKIKKGYTLREIAELTQCSTTTGLKVRKAMGL